MFWLVASWGLLCGQVPAANGPVVVPNVTATDVQSQPPSELGMPPPLADDSDGADPAGNISGLSNVLEGLIRTHLPNHYEDLKHWGQTRQVWSGLKVSLDGLRIDSEPRHKRVNHGTWKRYRVDLAQPNEHLALAVDNVHETADHRLHFDLETVVPLKLFGQLAKWERGVKLASLSGEADATVRFRGAFELGIEFDLTKLPPNVLLRPKVVDAQLQLVDFRLRRVSQLDGPFVKLLGEGLEEVLEDKLRDTNARLVAKLNRQIEKKQDKLRLSASDWLEKKLGVAK